MVTSSSKDQNYTLKVCVSLTRKDEDIIIIKNNYKENLTFIK